MRHKPDLRFISGADIEKRLCVIRNDVRRVSAFRENAVDALTLRNRLFPLKNAVIESDQGVQRIDPLFRRKRRMGSAPVEVDISPRNAQTPEVRENRMQNCGELGFGIQGNDLQQIAE